MHRGAMALVLAALVLGALPLRSQPQSIPYRMWELQDSDEAYLKKMIRLAPKYHINAIQFSHAIVHHAHQVLDEPDRAAKLRRLIQLAKSEGLHTYIWTHEFEHVPEEFVVDGKLQVDSTRIWQWLRQKYEQVYALLPDLAGIVLTATETDFRPNDTKKVHSKMTPEAILTRVANTLYEVSATRGKRLIFRTFTQNPEQFQGYQHALAAMHPDIIIMTKCVPFDWNPFFPNNSLLGAVAPHPQIVEFDLGQEYNGQSNFPFADPQYYLNRWNHARSKQVAGFVLRTERLDQHIVGTPNEVNLYAFKLAVENPEVSADEVWQAWGRQRYGQKAGQQIKAVLEPTAWAVRHMLYVRGMWFSDQSQIPTGMNLREYVQQYRLFAQYVPRPEYQAFAQKLLSPDETLIDWVIAEKESAVHLARTALQRLPSLRPFIQERDYLQLSTQLALLADYAAVFRQVAEVAFRAYLDRRARGDGRRMANRKALLASLQELMRLRFLYQTPLRLLHMERGRESDNVQRIDQFARGIAKIMRQQRWLRILKAQFSRDVSVRPAWPAGIVVPMFTPLTPRRKVDFSALRAYTKWLSRQAVDVLLPFADTNVAASIPLADRQRAISNIVTATAGKRLVFPVIPSNDAQTAAEMAAYALENRADGLCIDFSPAQDDPEEEFITTVLSIMSNYDLPVILLAQPNGKRRTLVVEIIERVLAQTDRLKAVVCNAADAAVFWDIVNRFGDRVAILANSERDFMAALLSGGAGLAANGNNVFPNLSDKLGEALANRQVEEAMRYQLSAMYWQKQLAAAPWPAAGQGVLRIMGVPVTVSPNAIERAQLQQLRKSFKQLMIEK
ncbi:MAG: dihydrodipicolinate synthase family protein [candidate division KSB1 bacterium]|nr:dihydrodipicolinate synthase family protein [candidate division KSB1 bacterium]MDQ7063640.1 dihydrodipicolinate synthase family protein [candidate division KSB1 bacterium]